MLLKRFYTPRNLHLLKLFYLPINIHLLKLFYTPKNLHLLKLFHIQKILHLLEPIFTVPNKIPFLRPNFKVQRKTGGRVSPPPRGEGFSIPSFGGPHDPLTIFVTYWNLDIDSSPFSPVRQNPERARHGLWYL